MRTSAGMLFTLIYRIDAGGLSAEWITLVIKEIMDPKLGLFRLSPNKMTL